MSWHCYAVPWRAWRPSAAIDIPDHTETLGVLQQNVNTAGENVARIGQFLKAAPALAMTPEQMAQRIAAAGSADLGIGGAQLVLHAEDEPAGAAGVAAILSGKVTATGPTASTRELPSSA